MRAEFFSDLPKVRKNEILIVPNDNRLWENGPFLNTSQKPQWWMNQDKKIGSIRRCHGTNDFISLGITFPMWTNVDVRPNATHTDFEVRMDQYGEPFNQFKNNLEFVSQGFPYSSTKECPFSSQRVIQGHYPKLVTPWQFKTAPGYSTLVLPNLLEPNPNYTVMPGVIHTDYYHTINIVLIVNTDKPFRIDLGTPMYQLVTFKRSDGIKNIVQGNESMYRFLSSRGTGEKYISNHDRTKSYRRLLNFADQELSDKKKKFFK